jgi:hypothetical protein
LPTLLYFLFSPPHIFFNSILASRTFGTFAFAPTHKANASAKANFGSTLILLAINARHQQVVSLMSPC